MSFWSKTDSLAEPDSHFSCESLAPRDYKTESLTERDFCGQVGSDTFLLIKVLNNISYTQQKLLG